MLGIPLYSLSSFVAIHHWHLTQRTVSVNYCTCFSRIPSWRSEQTLVSQTFRNHHLTSTQSEQAKLQKVLCFELQTALFFLEAQWPVFHPLADSIGVTDYDFVHPGKGLRKKNSTFKEAEMTSMQCQRKDHIFLFLCEETVRI